ncbi:MAG: aminotransferase class I/II-fold pyridoxal phosphate-dependent enzyme [Spirochaetales bacterium]|jgi:aspartate/methionine/tyrosine aminotransferase|nr:aminotransferase class I/II-fold pyridoxal phosphate-dependent enzyme [Spirochaetales bacterium]
MNSLAIELNDILSGTAAGRLLSETGRRLFFPRGIIAQSAEAGRRAGRFNATVGMSYENGRPMTLPSLMGLFPGFTAHEAVNYAPVGGDPQLRELWKAEMLVKNPGLSGLEFSLPLVTPGLTAGLSLTAELFVNPGDTFIIPDAYWDNYELIFREAKDANFVTFPFFDEEGHINCAGLKEAVMKNSRGGKAVIMLNFPNNPLGYSPSSFESTSLARCIAECADAGTDILVIIDDAYFGLFFDENVARQSFFASLANLHERVLAVKIDGATKEDFVWGFRIAFLTYASKGLSKEHYAALVTKTTAAIRVSFSSSSRIAQSALVKLMTNPSYPVEKEEKLAILKRRYLKVKEILSSRTAGAALRELPFNSGYFMSFLCEGISAEDLRKRLLDKGIGTIALQDRILRIAYQSIDEEGLADMYAALFASADELAGR